MPPLASGEGRAPARATVSGLVMLATLSPDALRTLYAELGAFTDGDPTGPPDLDSLLAVLAQVRRQGYAERTDHPHPGLVCVAAAVTVDDAPAPAAVVLVRPTATSTAGAWSLGEVARQAAGTIGRLLVEDPTGPAGSGARSDPPAG